MASKDPAPGSLQLVQDFINTRELLPDREEFSDLAALRRWLREHRLIGQRDRLAEGDVQRAIAVREALRGVLSSDRPAARDVRTLNAATAAAQLRVDFDATAKPTLQPAGSGLDRALGRLFSIIECASYEGRWSRMKICAADDCEWAFYDHTKNRSGAWCSMAVCGNRAKSRAFRERRHEHAQPGG